MKYKDGTYVRGVSIEAALGLLVADGVYQNHGIEMTITSGVDGTHSHQSEHYGGRAFDLRTRNIPPDKLQGLYDELCDALPEDFDCILEIDHIHLEYDPKGKQP